VALQKQAIPINFAQGLDTKTDPKQVSLGKFLVLENSIFTKGGLLQKRNGYQQLAPLPNASSTYLTTFNGNLTAVGQSIYAYSGGNEAWVSRGNVSPIQLSTLPLIRNSINQIQCDSTIASNGLICTVYSEINNGTTDYKYAVADSVTGQNITAPTLIPGGLGTVTGSPRVFVLGVYFVVVFTNNFSGVYHLQFIAISLNNPTLVTTPADLVVGYTPTTTVDWDGVVTNNRLFVAYNTLSGGQSIGVLYLDNNLNVSVSVKFTGHKATVLSTTVDITNSNNPVIYVSFYDSTSSTGYTLGVNQALATILSPTEIITSGSVVNIASAAQNGVCTIYYEVANNYGYDSSIPTHYVNSVTITVGGVVGATVTAIRSVGLASKAFIVNGIEYFLAAYQSPYQNTYFLMNGASTEASPIVVAKLAYENGGGYLTLGLPSVNVNGDEAQIPYLFKDLIEALSTNNNTQQTTTGGIYSQTGINLVSFTFSSQKVDTAEIGSNIQMAGGFLWNYDGYLPVENDFFLWPDSVEATWSATGGAMAAQPDGSTNTDAYYYQVTYEWADNQGNIYRSAPSIPVAVTTTGSGSAGSVTLYIPYLRLTYKIANPLKIVIYRWSVAHQTYYQVTSITQAQLNSTTTDYLTYVDTLADASIVGNNIIYTTGGVIENVNGPASNIMTLFDNRLWLVDAEDQNLLWYSKQVIEATPVEMSDLLTFYIAPSTASQGNTGPVTALAPMDDKLIIFKASGAIYYINGTGPDNTGANSQYSQPVFITSAVGCTNQNSIVLMPQGLMFQSDKGIWLLGRDLSTQYIGAPVEQFNSSLVNSAVLVPATNQVRFTLSTGQTLMYDFYYGQWGTFVNVPAISSCIFQGLHTFLNSEGEVFQETPGVYLDGSNPVLMTFTTSWVQIAGLQGYQRAYFFYLLGTYFSPHKLNLQISYDYVSSPIQNTVISPVNYGPAYGSTQMPVYGQLNPYGGGSSDSGASSNIEQWRVFLTKQRCTSFQITLQEVYDPSFGAAAGQGLTLSGLNLVVGIKKGWRPQPAATSAGSAS
jgi:hypothetical protein